MDKTHLFIRLATCRHPRQSGKKHQLALLATIFVLVLCMCPAKNHAQFYFTFYEQGNYTGYAYQNIHLISNWVKYPDRYSVSVVPYKLSQIIRLTNHNSFFTGFPMGTATANIDNIPEGMIIKDIETVDDYAVFCGSILKEDGLNGFIGYFDINDFSSGGLTVPLHWFVIEDVTSINELVVNYETGRLHVVALGERFENNSKSYHVFENTNLTGSTTSSLFSEKHLEGFETAFEIKSTDNYIAVIGSERADNALYIRRCSWSGGISDPGFNDVYYVIVPASDYLSRTHSTAMVDDKIAISYLSGENNDFSIRVRTIDLATISNTYSQELPLDTKVEPKELIYLPSSDLLVMLVDMEYPTLGEQNSLFIDIRPNPTISYSTGVSYFHHKYFYTLDCIGINRRSFMALGDNDKYVIRANTAPWPSFSNSCPYKDSIDFNVIVNAKFNIAPYPSPTSGNLYPCSNQSYSAISGPTSMMCYDY